MIKQLTYDVVVIGGGAAGLMAAITAGEQGAKVLLLERNQKIGRKLYITGKGRCNVTNHCDPQEFLAHMCCNAKFLYSAIHQFSPEKTESFFESRGVPLKTERGNRVFPQSDKATDIIDCLLRELRRVKVFLREDRAVSVSKEKDGLFHIVGEEASYQGKTLVIATGGVSYPATGATGDGYDMAESFGHAIVPLYPSLIPWEIKEGFCKELQGLSLRNVVLQVKNSKKKVIFSQQGELLYTHFGISGPLVLSASGVTRSWDKERYTCSLDLKPALTVEQLEARLLREFSEHGKQEVQNILPRLLPRLMVSVMANVTQIPLQKKGHDITKGERRRLLDCLKAFPMTIEKPRPLEEAVVTAGGVSVSQVNPKTMESKKVEGLYFAGELLDVDAVTGGFNLQIAWSTGYLAGLSSSSANLGGKI